MKRVLLLFSSIIMLFFFVGCSGGSSHDNPKPNGTKEWYHIGSGWRDERRELDEETWQWTGRNKYSWCFYSGAGVPCTIRLKGEYFTDLEGTEPEIVLYTDPVEVVSWEYVYEMKQTYFTTSELAKYIITLERIDNGQAEPKEIRVYECRPLPAM